MKKLLTIMLALLVIGGVAFAEDPPVNNEIGDQLTSYEAGNVTDSTTMTIQANAPWKFVSGFAANDVTTFGTILNYEFDATPYKTVLLDTTDNQLIAYYLLATNSRTDFSVTLTANRLKSVLAVDEGFQYIPYNLIIEDSETPVSVASDGTTHILHASSDDIRIGNGVVVVHDKIEFQLPSSLLVDGKLAVMEGNYTADITVAVAAN